MYIIDAEYQMFMKCTEEIVILANVSIVSMFNIEETHASTILSLRAWRYVGMQGFRIRTNQAIPLCGHFPLSKLCCLGLAH